MGKFLQVHQNSVSIITPKIDEFMKKHEFTEDTLCDLSCWSRIYTAESGSNTSDYYRVSISRESAYVHKETNYGGFIWDETYPVVNDNIESLDSFMEFLDEVYENIDLK